MSRKEKKIKVRGFTGNIPKYNKELGDLMVTQGSRHKKLWYHPTKGWRVSRKFNPWGLSLTAKVLSHANPISRP